MWRKPLPIMPSSVIKFSLVAACQMLKASFDRNTSKASANLAKTPVSFLILTWMLVDLLDMIGCRVSFPVLEV
jgi:hypothetical protein